jgi:hypothetical protein
MMEDAVVEDGIAEVVTIDVVLLVASGCHIQSCIDLTTATTEDRVASLTTVMMTSLSQQWKHHA